MRPPSTQLLFMAGVACGLAVGVIFGIIIGNVALGMPTGAMLALVFAFTLSGLDNNDP
ncbi:MAG: hypothetical protein OXE95_07230 [Chloroflexi bacterium]|nr:hypothetical protein [Chloroflexota bacterium]MCY4247348.1 hypothetical protein [Chloroflexota bacterium]